MVITYEYGISNIENKNCVSDTRGNFYHPVVFSQFSPYMYELYFPCFTC